MRVLITGASGFVGRHLVERLAQEHEIVAVVRQRGGGLRASEFRIVPSIDASTRWAGMLEGIDVVLHLAARVHVMHDTAPDPLASYREINVEGTRNLAESAAAQGVKRMVFLSSIKVNGEVTLGAPFSAQDEPAPVDPYGVSKLEAETALRQIVDRGPMGGVILRPPVIYGPGVKGNIARIMRLIGTGLPLPLGGIRNQRTMLSIGNLAIWVRRAITDESVPFSPVLVGDPAPISTSDLARILARGMGAPTRQFAVPAGVLRLGSALLGQRLSFQRLTEDLVIAPTWEAFPGIQSELAPTMDELERVATLGHTQTLKRPT